MSSTNIFPDKARKNIDSLFYQWIDGRKNNISFKFVIDFSNLRLN